MVSAIQHRNSNADHASSYRYCGYSYGDGIFLRLNTLAHDNLASFVVAKDHRRKSLVVKIKSAALKKFLHNAIRPDHQHVDMWPGEAPKESIRDTYSFEQLLSHYGQYRSYLSEIGMTACFSSFGKILTLFTRDFLLDLSIWRFFASKTTSFGHRLIDSSHWKDMRRWSMEKDLDDFTMLFNVHGGDRTHRDALDDAHLLIAVEAGDIQQVYDLLAQRYKPVEWEHLTAALNGCHRSVFGVLWQNFHLNDNLHALQATAVAAAMKGWLVELGMVVGRLEQQNFILPPVHHSLPELRYTRTLLFHDIVAAATRGGHCHVLAACFGFDGRTIPPYNSWGHSNPSRRDHFDDSGIPLIEFIVTTACDSGRGDVLDWLKTANWPDLGCIFSGITIQRCVKDYLRRLDTSRITTHSKYESRLDATQTSRSATRLNMKYDGHLSELMDVNMNAKQGCMMREGVRNRFLLQHSNFVRKLNSTLACGLLRKFQRSLSEPRTVWRQGIDTIRSLVSNVPPGNIADVFCCIQVSRAIRRSLRSRGKLIQLPTEDLADLKRWMSVLPEEQRRLFALVSQTLWNSKLVRDCIHGHDSVLSHCEECSLEPCENWRLCDEDALSHFQKMFETLMIETRNAGLFREGSEAQQGERLSEIQARYGGDPGGTPARGQSPAALSHWSTPPHQRPPDPPYPREDIEASSTLAQPRVVMLAATSMFMVIIALLVRKYCARIIFRSSLMTDNHSSLPHPSDPSEPGDSSTICDVWVAQTLHLYLCCILWNLPRTTGT